MADNKSIVLVTGGNAGIGYELTSQLLDDKTKHVLLGSRSLEKGQAAVKSLSAQSKPGIVELLQIDVTAPDTISKAAKEVESKYGRLDILVNNAAIADCPGTLAEKMARCYETNATGPLLVVEAFLDLLKKSKGTPRIVNVSSMVGSINMTKDVAPDNFIFQFPQYRTSKAALNLITATQAHQYKSHGIKVFAFCPGFTASSISDQNKTEYGAKPTSEGAAPIVRIINGERDAESGLFLHDAGQYPW